MIILNFLDEKIIQNQNDNDKNKMNIDINNKEYKKRAKEKIQEKYFGQKMNESALLLNYSNEISTEGGIYLILEKAETYIQNYGLQILISGKIYLSGRKFKEYTKTIDVLTKKYPYNFLAQKKDYTSDKIS